MTKRSDEPTVSEILKAFKKGGREFDAERRVPGYAVLNLDTRYQLDRHLQLFARIDNVLDRRHANFGVLGNNVFTGPAQGFDAANPRTEQFRGYGAPRGARVGLQYTFE